MEYWNKQKKMGGELMLFQSVKRMALSLLLACSLILSLAVSAFAEELPGSAAEGNLSLTSETAAAFADEFFAEPLMELYYKGAAISIVKDGEVLLEKGYGYANAEEEKPVDPANTVFRIASVSKTFTAVAIMQLVEQGKVNLDEDIRTYLPGIEFDNPYETPVTVAHLLLHRSGLEAREPAKDDLHTDFDRYVAMEDYVREHMPPVVREPGTAYMYDNFAYLLLGLIVQNTSGMPYEQYMDEHVFGPLGMTSSGFLLDGDKLERLVTGYDELNQPMEPYVFAPTIMPHGGMLSTAADMSRFMIAFLNGGAAPDGNRILSETSVEEMSMFRSAIHPILPDTTYGFEAASQYPLAGSSPDVIVKYGDLPGNSSMLLLIPKEKTGVFLTYNKMGVLREFFFEQFMGTFFPDYIAPADLDGNDSADGMKLEALAGVYSDLRIPALISLVELNEDGTLTIRDAYLGPRLLQPVDDYLFVDDITGKYTAFVLDEANQTVYMREPYLNPMGYARRGADPVGFVDVDEAHAYAPYILMLQSLGLYPNQADLAFEPEKPITRAELVRDLLVISGLSGSETESYAFLDIEGHPLAPYIQLAYEMGMVTGDGTGNFHPDRPVTRQEAAIMVWNLYRQMYPEGLFDGWEIAGETDEWALSAVKMVVALGLHGPELTVTEDGRVDFRSREAMTRQEAAAYLYQLLLQPVDQIVAQLMQQMP